MEIVRSLLLFFVAGLMEIGGGYLVWRWLKEDGQWWQGLAGCALLMLYGLTATLQVANFGKVYAAYGGIFIAMSLLWAWGIDGYRPDKFDLWGAAMVLAGVFIIIYMPRR